MPQPSELPFQDPKQVLIVDDDVHIRGVIRRAIEGQFGWICDEAFNGVDSISKARARQPDLVILDLAMPIMNGYETSLVLRRELPAAQIVFMTMYADVIGRRASDMLGVSAIVSKADGIQALMTCVEKLFAA